MKGFTLVEVMITVAILGIITAIALPSYQESVKKSKRVEMQSQMVDIASKLQRYKIANFTFNEPGTTTAITLSYVQIPTVYPTAGQALYNVQLANVTSGTWELEAVPKTGTAVATDGTLRMNSKGERCWAKGQSTCTLDASSNWDGK